MKADRAPFHKHPEADLLERACWTWRWLQAQQHRPGMCARPHSPATGCWLVAGSWHLRCNSKAMSPMYLAATLVILCVWLAIEPPVSCTHACSNYCSHPGRSRQYISRQACMHVSNNWQQSHLRWPGCRRCWRNSSAHPCQSRPRSAGSSPLRPCSAAGAPALLLPLRLPSPGPPRRAAGRCGPPPQRALRPGRPDHWSLPRPRGAAAG